MNKYVVCRICFQTNKNPPVLAVIDDYGIINIRRYHKASTVIGGTNISVTCDQCNSTIILQIRRKQPVLQNITGTILVEDTGFKYFYKNRKSRQTLINTFP